MQDKKKRAEERAVLAFNPGTCLLDFEPVFRSFGEVTTRYNALNVCYNISVTLVLMIV